MSGGAGAGARYLGAVTSLLERILEEEGDAVASAAELLRDQVLADRLVHVYGPGGTPTSPPRSCSSVRVG
ncbi:SIS domain-containing protein [Litorihabitans aurantiacus]|uniref:SIS domain-containing protein n=1 Tax=Litorihabitans aurantiacus TaxID=1930061 RepID=A0AA37UP32_9MICO|nr:SIS domain-containing protein [Litorihabitans aurantiacus]GMA31219.1 hypothetical protein GCM10025875_12110 [Litorihabitans aurantiacus]